MCKKNVLHIQNLNKFKKKIRNIRIQGNEKEEKTVVEGRKRKQKKKKKGKRILK